MSRINGLASPPHRGPNEGLSPGLVSRIAWQTFLVNALQTLRARYEVAFDTYHIIARRNSEQAMKGPRPTAEDLQREDDAKEALSKARQAYLYGLNKPTSKE